MFQCDWGSTFQRNGLDDLVWTINFGTGANIDAQFQKLKEARPNTPLMCSEFWTGWFDHWGRKHETRNAETMVSGIKDMVGQHISFSLYMAHGGTTFGHWGGANSPAYSAMCSSYDYDAPISEAGWATPKYYKLHNLLTQYADSGQTIPNVPQAYPVIEIPEFTVNEGAPLFSNLPKPKFSEDVKPMEQFDQGWGTILYQTSLPAVKDGTVLFIDEVCDWAQIYADGKLLGQLDRRRGQNTLVLPALSDGTRLDILVEAMGRVNFDMAIHDRKGITNKVELITDAHKHELKNWKVYSFPVDYSFARNKKYTAGAKLDSLAYYRATFNIDKVGDVFWDMQTPGNGWQEVKFDQVVKGRYFCLEGLSSQDGKDAAAVAEFYLLDENGKQLPRQRWQIAYANSESTAWGNFTADKIYDLQESTYWHTRDGDKYAHQFVIDTQEEVAISSFCYLPRAEDGCPGMIREYKVYVKLLPFTL